jgi:hypothetical protein
MEKWEALKIFLLTVLSIFESALYIDANGEGGGGHMYSCTTWKINIRTFTTELDLLFFASNQKKIKPFVVF